MTWFSLPGGPEPPDPARPPELGPQALSRIAELSELTGRSRSEIEREARGSTPGATAGREIGGFLRDWVRAARDNPEARPGDPPERTDPAVLAAGEEQRLSERQRRGRRASILTSGGGLEEGLGTVRRPEARSAQLLGGVGSA